jgi:hypothetical protein
MDTTAKLYDVQTGAEMSTLSVSIFRGITRAIVMSAKPITRLSWVKISPGLVLLFPRVPEQDTETYLLHGIAHPHAPRFPVEHLGQQSLELPQTGNIH